MKKLNLFLIALLTMLSTSCASFAQEIVYDNNVETITYSAIVTNGKPYFYNGSISHYLFNGVYYYPYVWNGVHYFKPFPRPMHNGFVFRPEYGHRPMPNLMKGHGHERPNFNRHRIENNIRREHINVPINRNGIHNRPVNGFRINTRHTNGRRR